MTRSASPRRRLARYALPALVAAALAASSPAAAGHGPGSNAPGAEQYTEMVPPAQEPGNRKESVPARELREPDTASAIADALTSREGYALTLLAVLLVAMLAAALVAQRRRRMRA